MGKGPAILVAAGDPTLARLIERLLRRGGWARVERVDRADAVAAALERGHVELVILDLDLPAGVPQLLERLSPRPAAPELSPVLAFSACQDPDVCVRALARGAQDCVRWPFDGEELILRARNLLRGRRARLALADHVHRLHAELVALDELASSPVSPA